MQEKEQFLSNYINIFYKTEVQKVDKTGEFMKKYFQVFLSIFLNIPMKNWFLQFSSLKNQIWWTGFFSQFELDISAS